MRDPSLQNRLCKKNDPTSFAPKIPTFSISDVVNNFVSRRPSLARRHAPARSFPRIEPTPTGEVSGALLRRAGSEAHSTTRRDRRFSPNLTPVLSDRIATHKKVTRLCVRWAPLRGQMRAVWPDSELGSARGVWTSQEKEDKWDDLLERRKYRALRRMISGSRPAHSNWRRRWHTWFLGLCFPCSMMRIRDVSIFVI